MNRKSLLFVVVASLMTLSAGAQSRKSDAARSLQRPPLSRMNLQTDASVNEMPKRTPAAAPVRDHAPLKPFYRRPAGAFYCPEISINGVGGYSLYHDIVLFKPYAEYTFYGSVQNADENTEVSWDVYNAANDNPTAVDHESILKTSYGISIQPMPIFYATDGPLDDPSANWYSYQMPYYSTSNGNVVENLPYAEAWAVPDPYVVFNDDDEEVEFLLSSKTACRGGRNHDLDYTWITDFYSGATPFVIDPTGRWFGKNTKHVDGMAQAFERPEHPYLLKKVCLNITSIQCSAPVSLTCKVYRLEDIPPYQDEGCAILPEEPGELIAFGQGIVDPMTMEERNGLVEFILLSCDEDDPDLVFEYKPTIDYPILVTIEGYNEPAAADLEDFTAFICADYNEDEGYGELAYLKAPINDDEGNFTGRYEWTGLNHFYHDWEMKTGFSIFIVADQPYLAFSNDDDGDYVFPLEGGLMDKYPEHPYVYDDDVIYPSIEFLSSNPSEDWDITWNGSSVLPDWLEIELEDEFENDEFTGVVNVFVTADPMPIGVESRSAVIRFSIPGDYQDYKFMQAGVAGVAEQLDSHDAVAVGYYDIMGHKLQSMQQGLNIVMMSDGTVRKLFLK